MTDMPKKETITFRTFKDPQPGDIQATRAISDANKNAILVWPSENPGYNPIGNIAFYTNNNFQCTITPKQYDDVLRTLQSSGKKLTMQDPSTSTYEVAHGLLADFCAKHKGDKAR